jgi:hypothetical protein
VSDVSFLGGVEARKGRWRDSAAEAKGISTVDYWTGKGSDALEVAYGTAVNLNLRLQDRVQREAV